MNEDSILYIGSDDAERESLGRILFGYYDFASSETVEKAITTSLQATPALILLSRTKDDQTLAQNAKALLAHKRLRNIFILAIRDGDSKSEVTLGRQIIDTIDKPFRADEVRHCLRIHLNLANQNRQMWEQVELLQSGLISSISEMVECRDENTGGHITRTSHYVMLIGMQLFESGVFGTALSIEDVEHIGRAAPLHDIGKVGVSDAILLKPGKLTDEEFAAMKRHAAVGRVMLEKLSRKIPDLPYLAYASEIAGTHHEKFDGSGYPDGIAGEDIPLCGRIMAVADVYDALVADRVYRKAMSQETAYRIITESSGTHFDPRIVEAFVTVFDMISAIAQTENVKIAVHDTDIMKEE